MLRRKGSLTQRPRGRCSASARHAHISSRRSARPAAAPRSATHTIRGGLPAAQNVSDHSLLWSGMRYAVILLNKLAVEIEGTQESSERTTPHRRRDAPGNAAAARSPTPPGPLEETEEINKS